MKKLAYIFIFFLAVSLNSVAQDYRESVYLTDGSIIKGVIIEQVPDEYLKIETTNGRVYRIEMYEVEKITKTRLNKNKGARNERRRAQNEYQYNYNNRDRQRNRSGNYYDDDWAHSDYGWKRSSFGIKAALNFSNTAIEGFDSKIGFTGGLFSEYRFNYIFALQPELLFSMQGAKGEASFNGYNASVVAHLNYINIPVMAKFYAIEGLSFEAGPQLGILVYGTATGTALGITESEDLKSLVNDIDFSLNFGASYQLPRLPLGFHARYSLGLTDIPKETGIGEYSGKNRVFQMGLFYKF